MRIYLAASYTRRDELRGYAADLEAMGHTVTARWLHGDHELVHNQSDYTDAFNRQMAEEDVADVLAADCVISFTETPKTGQGRTRGGRHVEFGLALGTGRRLIVVPCKENVFHWLSGVECYPTWDQCRAALVAAELAGLPGER